MKKPRKQKYIEARKAADPLAQALGRDDIDYESDELPTAPRGPKVIDVEPEPQQEIGESSEAGINFIRGAVWACARLVEMYDQPTMAAAILKESGAKNSDLKQCTEYDLAFLRKETLGIPKGKQ